MTLLDKEPVRRVGRIIREFDQNLSVSVLETSARTALEAASSLGCEVGAIVKSLLFKTDNKFSLFLVAGDKKASLRKIKKNIKFDDVSMATAEDVKNITGKFFANCQVKKGSSKARNEKHNQKLWELSEEFVKPFL